MYSKYENTGSSALELLNIVHKFCISENIVYTISADTLINYEYSSFLQAPSTIYITLMNESFINLKKYLEEFCKENTEYSIHDFANTEQFNTLDMWFVKRPNDKLKFNDASSFYYGTRLVITPLFFAGNTYKEWLSIYKKYCHRIATLNLFRMLPKRPIISRIRQLPKSIITAYYSARRGKYTIRDIVLELNKNSTSKYVLYPYIITRFKEPNLIPWGVGRKSFNLTYEFWSNVKIINFYGVECYCLCKAKKLLECFSNEYINQVLVSSKNQLIYDGGEKLRVIQLLQLDLLIEFDRICKKNNLKYNISFGTLLGAVRHKGFIPWDDDIDVTMPLKDYIKLDVAMKSDLNSEKYYYRTPETEENNHLIFKHLERKGTVYTKPGRNKLKNKIGIFIDIFPMYPAAPNRFLDWFHAKLCCFWRTALWATIGAESEKNKFKHLYYCCISKFGNKRCYANFIKCATIFRNKKGRLKFWIAMDRNPYNVALVKEENYSEAIELDFEGHKFLAPQNYKEVLDYCFGKDWCYYPIVNQRKPQHNAIIDLGNIYNALP